MNLEEIKKEYEELAHAYFEPGDKGYWDAIEFASDFFASKLTQHDEEMREKIRKLRKVCPIYGGIINRGHSCEPAKQSAYNQAIDDILSTILPKEKESK